MTPDPSTEALEDEVWSALQRVFAYVPLSAYDDSQKLVENAVVALESRMDALAARLSRAEEALRQIEAARPTKGVPIKDTLEGCNIIARAALPASSAGETE